MAEAGINLSITGDAQGFNDAATQAAKTAETTAREVADIAKRQAEAERRRYDDAMADLRRTTQARINAAKDVQKAEASAAKAAAEANTRNTAESRAAAQAKAAEAAAARRAATAATEHQQAAAAAAAKTRQAMRDSATEATRAAEAHLRAATGLARAQAGARARGLPGLNLPGGKERGTGQGGAGIGRIVIGALAGGGSGGGGGGASEALGSLGEATEVIEGIISGGAVEIIKNGDKVVNLIKTYGLMVARAAAIGTTVIGTGVAIGQAIGDWDSFIANVAALNKKTKALADAIGNPADAAHAIAEWVTAYASGAKQLEAQAEKMEKDFAKYQVEAGKEMARRRGEVVGSNAANLGRAQQQGIASRQEALNRGIAEREAAIELEKIRIDGIQSEADKSEKLAALERSWLKEKAKLIRDHADYEYQRALDTHAEAKKSLDELKDAERKNRLAAGASGTTPELERIRAAMPGVESRYEAARAALEGTAKAAADAKSGERTAELQGQAADQRRANEDAAREAERARQSSALKLRKFWQDLENIVTTGIENAKRAADQAANRKTATEDLRILELRARGRNRQADRIMRERETDKIAKDYQASTGATAEEARAYAERQVAAKDPVRGRRIRGAGAQPDTSGGPPKTGIDAVTYRLLNGGTVPGGMPPEPKPASEFRGLDALAEMQKKNRRIRGAGATVTDGEAAAGAVGNAAGNLIGNGVGGVVQMVIGQLAGINKKLENLAPSKQPIRR